MDFYATVIDYANIKPTHTPFGKSLAPVLANRSTPHRNYVFCEGGRMQGGTHCDEYHAAGEHGKSPDFVYLPQKTAQRNDEAHAKGTMIFDGRYKYILRATVCDEFYDLKTDPGETQNSINCTHNAEHITNLRHQMLIWYQSTCDVVPLDFDKRFTPEMLWARIKSFVPPKKRKR